MTVSTADTTIFAASAANTKTFTASSAMAAAGTTQSQLSLTEKKRAAGSGPVKRHISLIVRSLARGGHLPFRGVATASSTLCVSAVLNKGKQVL